MPRHVPSVAEELALAGFAREPSSDTACSNAVEDPKLTDSPNLFAALPPVQPISGPVPAYVGRGPSMPNKHHSPSRSDQPFEYLMVLDFEATCSDNEPTYPNEIIEFPVVLVDMAAQRVVSEFHSFVRPIRNPTLTPFCRHLTGIKQAAVDAAPMLPEAVRRFDEWMCKTVPEGSRCIFATDGPWDLRHFLFEQAVCRDGLIVGPVFSKWINVRRTFSDFFHIKPCGVEKMLARINLSFEGRPHRGIDDARNIARIVLGLVSRGCVLGHVSSISEGDLVLQSTLATMNART